MVKQWTGRQAVYAGTDGHTGKLTMPLNSHLQSEMQIIFFSGCVLCLPQWNVLQTLLAVVVEAMAFKHAHKFLLFANSCMRWRLLLQVRIRI